MGNNTAKLNVTVEISECTNSDYIVCFHSPRRSSTIYIYIYIYMCVCVCVCVFSILSYTTLQVMVY